MALHHWGHVSPLDGGPGDHDHANSETTQQYQTMTTTSPVSPVGRSSLCSHQLSNRSVPPHLGRFVSGWRWFFPTEFASRNLVSPFDLELENILEDHGVSWQTTDEMLGLELETYRRCFSAQLALSALQRFNRRKCAFLLRDLAAAGGLPSHSALFSQQLLDLTHRWWTERERADTDIDINDVNHLATS